MNKSASHKSASHIAQKKINSYFGSTLEKSLKKPDASYRISFPDPRFKSLGLIGKGGFSNVLCVVDKYGRKYAAKLTVFSSRRDAEIVSQEIAFHSENYKKGVKLVPIYFHTPLYMIQEHCDSTKFKTVAVMPYGVDLYRLVTLRKPKFDEMGELSLAYFLFDSLASLASARTVHRDVKPMNFIVYRDERSNIQIRLSDFGISKTIQNKVTFFTNHKGTMMYLAPEQLSLNEKTLRDFATASKVDVYAMCLTILQILNGGVIPTEYENPALRLLNRNVDLSRYVKSPVLRKIIERGLRVNPTERYSAAEAKNMLSQALLNKSRR